MSSEDIQYSYIPAGDHGLFGCLHPAAPADRGGNAVLVCSPWGWDEVASYRPRRAWAQRLAAAGHPTLRFDWPGAGNSSGSPRDADLVSAWLTAVLAAIEWLRATSRRPGVTVIGLGLGGLLALEAIRLGSAVDELVLWGAPLTGRDFVREVKNFSRLLARLRKLHGTADGEAGSTLPDTWLESSGFVLSAETVSELEALDPLAAIERGPRRALLVSRHRNQNQTELAERLRGLGTEVELGEGRGWGAMVSEPAEARLPDGVIRVVGDWLAADPAPNGAVTTIGAATLDSLQLQHESTRVVETPISISPAFGILATPAERAVDRRLCAVFFNAGAVRDVGPNRMWVERARAWAGQGIPCLRVDLEEIGEGDGDPDGIPPGDEHFSTKFEPQIAAVLDTLSDLHPGTRFVLVGLCSGAYHAFRTALVDERVCSALMINPGVLVFRPEILTDRELKKDLATFEGKRVAKLFRGEVGPRRAWHLAVSLVRDSLLSLAGRVRRMTQTSWAEELDADLDGARAKNTRFALAFSNKEITFEELEAVGFPDKVRAGRWPNLSLEELPGNDHTLRPTVSQAALAEFLDGHLERELQSTPKRLETQP